MDIKETLARIVAIDQQALELLEEVYQEVADASTRQKLKKVSGKLGELMGTCNKLYASL